MPDIVQRPSALQARYVFPVDRPPIEHGVVTIDGPRIVAVGRKADCPVRDLGNVAILPGLVNAHTHLEFADLDAPLGTPGMPLADWIRLVRAHRTSRLGDPSGALRRGLAESAQAGTTLIGEIATVDAFPSAEARADLVVFRELIGLSLPRAEEQLRIAQAHLNTDWSHDNIRPGLSPHAPYSVRMDLLRACAELSKQSGAPLAMHLAESREELELLAAGTGPLRAMLEEFGAWDAEAFAPRLPIMDFLCLLAWAERALVVHGNYLSQDEVEFISQRRASLAVVYCPRTHAYFGHEPYPLEAMLAAGVRVALGTDSRASNPDLDVLGEMRQVARAHPRVAPEEILKMATLAGAAALGCDATAGSLEPGKVANLAIVRLPEDNHADPHELLFLDETIAVETWWRGRKVAPIDGRNA